MNKSKAILLLAAVLLILSGCSIAPKPPVAKQELYELVKFGDTRIDPYYWMNKRDSQDVISYLNAENDYTNKVMQSTEKLQSQLVTEMRSRIKEDDISVPVFENGYYYYTRFEEGKEYPIHCRKKGSLDANEEILLNVNELAKGYSYFSATGLNVSTNNNVLAFGVDTVSRRQYTIYFKDLTTGKLLDTKISNTTGAAVWANDNQTVFYSVKDESLRPYQIYRHTISNSSSSNDDLVYEENDETFNVFVYKSKSNAYLFFGSSSTMSDEYHFIDANKPNSKLRVIQPRERGLEYSVDHFENNFYIRTNHEAMNFRLMKALISKPSKANWIEVIPHRSNVYLSGFEIFKNFLVLDERKDGLKQVKIIEWQGGKEHYINFGEEVYSAWIGYNPEFNTNLMRYTYTSLTTPTTVFDYNMASQEKTLLKQTEILGDFKSENYEAKRLWATATDGAKIPISIVYRKGLAFNGKNPTLQYAYGSYGASTDPYFSSNRLSLLDRGFVFAIAHVRGGQELGRQWYEDGKLLKKINTFTDFTACSDYLIEQKYTNSENLFAMGGSAGGLLMGAIANLRPNLYKGIIAQVPFVDVVTTMLDSSIPLTTGEYDEWGNPNDSTYYFYMKSYSPYDQVTAQNYPNMLITTGYHDSQVQYFEPAKWVAKLRNTKTDKNLILFKINMEAGHGGASGRFKMLEEVALEYAFMLKLLNK